MKLDIFLTGKHQGAIRTDRQIYCIFPYHFCTVATILKVVLIFQQLDRDWYSSESK